MAATPEDNVPSVGHAATDSLRLESLLKNEGPVADRRPSVSDASNELCASGVAHSAPTSQSARVPSEFLTVYDYGMGGLWAIVVADTVDQITTRYPEVTITTERPAWIDDARFEQLRREATDIDSTEDEGIFNAVAADRAK